MNDWPKFMSAIARSIGHRPAASPLADTFDGAMARGPLLRLAAEMRLSHGETRDQHLKSWTNVRRSLPAAQVIPVGDSPQPTEAMDAISGLIADAQTELRDASSLSALFDRKPGSARQSPGELYLELLKAASDLWAELNDGVRDIAESTSHTSDVADPRGLIPKLNAMLASRYPELGGEPVVDLAPLRGGGTKLTAIVTLKPNSRFTGNLVLRMDVTGGQTATIAADEFDLLSVLAKRGVCVPNSVFAERDPAVLGGSFLLLEEVQEAVKAGPLFPGGVVTNSSLVLREAFYFELAASLARVHEVTEENEPNLRRNEQTQASVTEFHSLWQRLPKPPLSIATDLGFAWLLNNPITGPRPRAMVHGDISLANTMSRDGYLAAILDWELAHFGDPAEDLGYARSYFLEPLGQWPEFQRAYLAAGGEKIACDPFAVTWYAIWGHVRNTVYIAGLRELALRGVRDDIVAVDGCTTLHAEVQTRLLSELNSAISSSSELP